SAIDAHLRQQQIDCRELGGTEQEFDDDRRQHKQCDDAGNTLSPWKVGGLRWNSKGLHGALLLCGGMVVACHRSQRHRTSDLERTHLSVAGFIRGLSLYPGIEWSSLDESGHR